MGAGRPHPSHKRIFDRLPPRRCRPTLRKFGQNVLVFGKLNSKWLLFQHSRGLRKFRPRPVRGEGGAELLRMASTRQHVQHVGTYFRSEAWSSGQTSLLRRDQRQAGEGSEVEFWQVARMLRENLFLPITRTPCSEILKVLHQLLRAGVSSIMSRVWQLWVPKNSTRSTATAMEIRTIDKSFSITYTSQN